jgi:hypothetical protein
MGEVWLDLILGLLYPIVPVEFASWAILFPAL